MAGGGRGLIRLRFREMGSWFSVEQYLEDFTPTPRATDRRGHDLPQSFANRPENRNTTRDEAGRFTTTGTPDLTERVHELSGTADPPTLTEPTHEISGTSPDAPDGEPGRARTIAPEGAEFEQLLPDLDQTDDTDLEQRKRQAIASLNQYAQTHPEDTD